MAFDRDDFLRAAIEIPSHEQVEEMRTLLIETLRDAGHEPQVDDAGNVLATRKTGTGDHLVCNTHLDTVGPHVQYSQEGDRIRGRGACDAKDPLAALLDAFCSASIEGQLTLAVTPDEETSQIGAAQLAETLAADGYIVGEPTGLDVCTAARGSFGGRVTIYGESAHAAAPDSGRNPIRAVGPVLDALDRYDEDCGPGEHPRLGRATMTPTHIEAGGPINQTPEACTISFDRRPVPPETLDEFVDSLRTYLADRLPAEYRFEVASAFPDSEFPDAFATDHDTPLVQTLAAASGGALRTFEAATEAAHFAPNGPTVVFGPGVLADEDGPVAHAEREYVDKSDIAAAATAVQETVESILS